MKFYALLFFFLLSILDLSNGVPAPQIGADVDDRINIPEDKKSCNCNWTQWMNSGSPDGTSGSDDETFTTLRIRGYDFCESPVDIQCYNHEMAAAGLPLELGFSAVCHVNIGLTCSLLCDDYSIRVACCYCPPEPTEITCSRQISPVNGAVSCTNDEIFGSVCTFTCSHGFKLMGGSSTECREAGWTKKAPTCEQITCPAVSSPKNGNVSCSKQNYYNSQCVVFCNTGYDLPSGAQGPAICQLNGRWSKALATCRRAQLTCQGNFTTSHYAGGDRFVTVLDEKNYNCACQGEDCQQITCLVLKSTTEEPEYTETCTDPNTGRVYLRGKNFIRYGQSGVNFACTCPLTGPLKIQCIAAQCVIPLPPPPTRSHFRNITDSCYDQHTDNWHRYNVPYVKKVIMSYSPDIIGQYSCVCTRFSSHCSAVDMPCCDTRTGRFVAKNQRFITGADGLLPMSCVCLGGRGGIGQCEQLHDRREIGQSRRIERMKRCYDPTADHYYQEGATFIQIKRNGERICVCRKQRRKLKIACRLRYVRPRD